MTGTIINSRKISSTISELIRTVERLDPDDQERILRIVTLLTMVPARVQDATQRRLRRLLESKPATAYDCIEAVDEVIEYLEQHADATDFPGDAALSVELLSLSNANRYN